jgi:hypothetical protein
MQLMAAIYGRADPNLLRKLILPASTSRGIADDALLA